MRLSRQLLFSRDTEKLELLLTPLNRLPITAGDGEIGVALAALRDDIKRVGIRRLEPTFYLSTGYGTVEGTVNIAIGFYDAHPLIRELHKEFRRWLYSPEEILSTLRHEIGHAFCYAYKLYRRKDFRETFNVRGHFFRTYPVTNRYVERANPWSRDYVNPMGDHYAQKHPDDDFAETFCVWFTPRNNWRREYRRYPGAMKKLLYVDAVVRELRRQVPELDSDPTLLDEPVTEYSITLAEFLKARPSQIRRRATGFIDADLRRLFHRMPTRATSRSFFPAEDFLRESKPLLVNRVSKWARVDPIVVKDLLDKCARRSEDLGLIIYRDEKEKTFLETISYLSMRCTRFALQGSFFG